MIPVTKAYLPNFESYQTLLKEIWDSNHLTNNGSKVVRLEKEISKALRSSRMLYVTNGTIALQLAIKALKLAGEIITTPYSYVATTSSILWENCKPIFVDIDDNANICPIKLRETITKDTVAILATHVFGYPCQIEALDEISKEYNIPVIYDGAHAFGVKYKEISIFNFGDLSTCSFHATKLFHTVEGGAVFVKDEKLKEELSLLRSFGHIGDNHISLGVNGKQSELHAAMGLCILSEIDKLILERKSLYTRYSDELGTRWEFINKHIPKTIDYNYAYVPILCSSESELLSLLAFLKPFQIYPRRYFYPSLNTLPYLLDSNACPRAEDWALRSICLPIYNGMTTAEQDLVIEKMIAFRA